MLVIPTSASRVSETAWRALRIGYAVAAWVAAAYVVFSTLRTASQTYTRIIFWDMWRWIDILRTWLQDGFTWSSLFAPDAEHRLVVGRLLYFLDYLIGSQSSRILVSLTIVQYAAALGALVAIYRRARREHPDWISTATLFAFAATLLFAGSNLEIIQFGWHAGYVWALVAMPVAALTVLKSLEASDRGSAGIAIVWLAVTIAICITATFTTGAGMPIWFLILAVAGIGGAPRKHLLAIAAFAVLCIGAYFYDYAPGDAGGSNPAQTAFQLQTYVVLLPLYLSNLLAPEFHIAMATGFSAPAWYVVLGVLGLIATVLATILLARSLVTGRRWQAAQVALLAIMGFAVFTGLMVALSRQNWGWVIVFVDRYRTGPGLFWSAGLALLLSIRWQSIVMQRAVQLGAGVLAAGMIATIVSHQQDALRYYLDRHQHRLMAADALRVDVVDWAAYRQIEWLPDPRLPSKIRFIREHRLSVFSDKRFELVGVPLSPRFSIPVDEHCNGEISTMAAVMGEANAWRLSGRAWSQTEGRAPHYLLVVDDDTRRIVGLGTGGLTLVDYPPDVVDVPVTGARRLRTRDGWAGYVRVPAGSGVTVYGVSRDERSVCRIAAARIPLK